MSSTFNRIHGPALPEILEDIVIWTGGTKELTGYGIKLRLPYSRELTFPELRTVLIAEYGNRWRFLGPRPTEDGRQILEVEIWNSDEDSSALERWSRWLRTTNEGLVTVLAVTAVLVFWGSRRRR